MHAAANIPVEPLGAHFAHFPNDDGLPRFNGQIGFPHSERARRSLLVTARMLAEPPQWPIPSNRFSRFVTSATAPIVTGLSDVAGWVCPH